MKKYILKPGKHQFSPGSPAVHSNENLTDDEAEWYLQKYPHIVRLFIARPLKDAAGEVKEKKIKMKRPRTKRVETSTLASGEKGGI